MTTTSPDSVDYPDIGYGLLGPVPTFTQNVIEVGAIGDGIADDIDAIQEALDAIAANGGGTAIFPGLDRVYRITRPMVIPSNTTLYGIGMARIKSSSGADFQQSSRVQYFDLDNIGLLATNAKNAYPINPADRDSNITLVNLTFDFADYGSGNGSGHAMIFIGVQGLTLRNVWSYAGPSAEVATGRLLDGLAALGCTDVMVDQCRAYWWRNCGFDFWTSPENVTIQDCYVESFDGLQLVNFNPDSEPSVGGYLPNMAAIGFTMTRCHLVGTGATARPIQIERLSASSTNAYVEKVLITENRFENAFLALRGDIRGLTVTDNDFRGYPVSSSNVIRCHPLFSGTATGVLIADNLITDPGTAAGQFGVIWAEFDSGIVSGNRVLGTTYTGEPFYQGTSRPNQVNNYFEKLGITGRMRQGFALTNADDILTNQTASIGWEDLNSGILRMYMAGNFHQFWSTNPDTTLRQVWSLQAANSNSQLTLLIGVSFGDVIRVSPATGLTATGTTQPGALQLTKCFNEITTTPLSSGVILQSGATVSNVGLSVTIWNAGANTLNVYPPTSAQIDALGLNNPDTIVAGANKTYVGLSTTLYRTKT